MKGAKTTIAILVMAMALSAAYADEEKSVKKEQSKSIAPETLFGGKDISLSGYGAPYVSISKIGDKTGVFAGGRGGLIINDSFVIGLGGMGLSYPLKREDITGTAYTGDKPYLNMGYGGAIIEYHFLPKKLIHISIGTMIGGGGLAYSEDKNDEGSDSHHNGPDRFFVAEPEAHVYVNITRFMRVGIGAGYRYVNGINSEDIKDSDFRGFNASVIAAFGWF